MSRILNQQLQQYRFQMVEVVKDLHQMAIDINNASLSEMVSELRNRIHEPFMFVIVGEVKVGKSSFVNALLEADKEVTKVAPDPCTDTIQQILYGKEEQTVVINPYLKKIFYPVEILKEIAIVDTPGTNTIIEHHQEITERFIPGSDLIVFVFEAKNPYRQSAWEFFDYIHKDWQKKVIFILQQKDLMKPADLETNINGVIKQAKKKGISNPNVFAVSAMQEQEGNENSGFKVVRGFIRENITGGQAPVLKLKNNLETAQNVSKRISSGLEILSEQYEADFAFRKDITETLDEQATKSKKQVDVLVENMTDSYDNITLKTEKKLQEGLGFFTLLRRTFASIFSKKESSKAWLDEVAKNLETELNTSLTEKLNNGVGDIADNIQQMVKIIDLKIRNSKTVLKDNQHIFTDLSERRTNVLRDLQNEFSAFINKSENFADASMFPEEDNFSPNIATGSGLAAIGVILATVTQGMVFDITGGVLTVIGLAISSFTVSSKRKQLFEEYNEAITKGKEALQTDISHRLNDYINTIKEKIDRNFDDFDALLEIEERQVKQYTDRFEDIKGRIEELEKVLK
ncbi:MAG: dynamin family protein [Saprospiraceae bacterium]